MLYFDHMENIGSRIATTREEAKMTQSALAKKIGTTQSAIARLESGNQNISSDMIKRNNNTTSCAQN